MNNAIETIEYKGHAINIYIDVDKESPRDWDNLGTMLCFHRRYELGDKTDLSSDNFNGWKEVYQYLKKELNAVVIHPLYLYDHSGISISIDHIGCYADRWDSGQVGFIYTTRDKILEDYNCKKITKKILIRVENCLESEVKTYDQYLRGDIYGYVIDNGNGDSCWGFYGDNFEENGLLEYARNSIDYETEKTIARHTKDLKTWIKNHVPLQYRKPLSLYLKEAI